MVSGATLGIVVSVCGNARGLARHGYIEGVASEDSAMQVRPVNRGGSLLCLLFRLLRRAGLLCVNDK